EARPTPHRSSARARARRFRTIRPKAKARLAECGPSQQPNDASVIQGSYRTNCRSNRIDWSIGPVRLRSPGDEAERGRMAFVRGRSREHTVFAALTDHERKRPATERRVAMAVSGSGYSELER